MNTEVQLSDRLSAVAEYVLQGHPMADIGTDHALLPVYLIQKGIVPQAVAGDIHRGPAQAAERQVQAAGLSSRVSVRIGDGLAVLSPGEAATVTIAGMGGGTMAEILNSAGDALIGVRRLVLQPNIGERIVREWLAAHHWKLIDERLIEEDGLLYEVMAADRSDPAEAEAWNQTLYSKTLPNGIEIPRDVVMLLGPYLIDRPSELFVKKWSRYVNKQEERIEQIGRSNQPEAERKRNQWIAEKEAIEEVLRWVSR